MKKTLPFLAVAFSGFLVYLFDKIWGNSIDWEKIKTVKIGRLISTQFTLLQILTFLSLAIAFYFVGKKILTSSESYYNRKQKELRKFNRMEFPEVGILLKWDVYFDSSGKPKITNLTAFCKKHEGAPPLRYINKRCSMENCTNSENPYNEIMMKNAIESELIDKWETLNK